MSDHWEQFPCTIGDHSAFIAYDHGVRAGLELLSFEFFARFNVALLDPDDRGLPHGDEFLHLNAVEDFLSDQFQPSDGLQVGRVTTNGYRYFCFYTSLSAPACMALAKTAGSLHGHRIELFHELDPQRSHYWNDLFPTDDDWQVVLDLRVQNALVKEGDSLQTPRPIEHWAYFKTEPQRAAFIASVKDLIESIDLYETPDAKGGPFTAKLSHVGLPDYRSMNRTTLQLSRAARENGGKYDGWETQVCKQ